jgi:hypothetical protein
MFGSRISKSTVTYSGEPGISTKKFFRCLVKDIANFTPIVFIFAGLIVFLLSPSKFHIDKRSYLIAGCTATGFGFCFV